MHVLQKTLQFQSNQYHVVQFQSGAGVSVSMTLAFAKNLLNALPIAEVTNWSRSITFCLNVFTHLKNTIGC
ncbi:hypothetical protein ACOSQ4_020746 [Xanthoceras sorbifolium]